MDIKPIEDKSKRHTTFTKRRQGLFKKTKMFCDRGGATAAVIVFSKAGNGFGFGHPHVEEVIDRYLADQPSTSGEVEANSGAVVRGDCGKEEEAALPMTEAETRFSEAMATGQPPWDVVMRGLELRELGELEETVRKIKRLVAERVKAAAGEGAYSKPEN